MKKNIVIVVVIALISSLLISGCCSRNRTMSQDEMKEFILEQRDHEGIFSDDIEELLNSTESTVEIIRLSGELSGYGEFHIYLNEQLVAGGVITL